RLVIVLVVRAEREPRDGRVPLGVPRQDRPQQRHLHLAPHAGRPPLDVAGGLERLTRLLLGQHDGHAATSSSSSSIESFLALVIHGSGLIARSQSAAVGIRPRSSVTCCSATHRIGTTLIRSTPPLRLIGMWIGGNSSTACAMPSEW